MTDPVLIPPTEPPGGIDYSEAEVRFNVRLMNAEITGIINRMADKLITFTDTDKGRPGSELRTTAGDMQSHVAASVHDGTLPDQMLATFNAAVAAGITVTQLDPVLDQLRSEDPLTLGALWTAQTGIFFALSAQCKIIAATTFESRDDIEEMQARMKRSFDFAKDMAADDMGNIVYQRLVDLAAKLARYLATTSMSLPSVVWYYLSPLPALATSYRIYQDASRSDELIADNKIVHPAFCRAAIRALSKAKPYG